MALSHPAQLGASEGGTLGRRAREREAIGACTRKRRTVGPWGWKLSCFGCQTCAKVLKKRSEPFWSHRASRRGPCIPRRPWSAGRSAVQAALMAVYMPPPPLLDTPSIRLSLVGEILRRHRCCSSHSLPMRFQEPICSDACFNTATHTRRRGRTPLRVGIWIPISPPFFW